MPADTAVMVNISEMIDLAIGTPEVGIVDFNMLQTVLHCLAQQLRVLDKHVELRGSVATLPIVRGMEAAQTIAVSEFAPDPNVPGTFELAKEIPPTTDQDTILVVQRIKKPAHENTISNETREGTPVPGAHSGATQGSALTSQSESGPSGPGQGATQTSQQASSQMTRRIPSTERIGLVTVSKFNILEGVVDDLKSRVYGTSPKNEDLLQEVRSQTNLKAITDMWNNLNVSSRLNAAEEGIAKLSSLVEDLIAETVQMQVAAGKEPSAAAAKMIEMAKAVTAETHMSATAPLSQVVTGAGTPGENITGAQPMTGGGPSTDLFATRDELKQTLDLVQNLKNDFDVLTKSFYESMKEVNKNFEPPSDLPMPSKTQPNVVSIPFQQTHDKTSAAMSALEPMAGNILERLAELEKKLQICCETIQKSDGLVSDQLASFQDQLEHLHKQLAIVSTDSGGKLTPDVAKDLQGLMQLFQTVQQMQSQLQSVHETALQLAAEKEDRQSHIDALLEQIELLKTIKLDREDMVEALADKADLRMLARKVSHDQFEMACDDLAKGLEHALSKLNVQEALWQQALDDIQREIETKLDKMELSPVKDFFNNKLKQLQENLKQMAALRREAHAAGTKSRLLRDVNCISCDAKAVMSMDPPIPLPPKPLPATMSMKPYLSYELDAIRKTQASSLPQRNMHDWEHIDRQMQPRQPYKVRSGTDKHLCNRYCGGSHTVTTPAQRVSRLGHFIKQWGPEVLPLSSGYAAGDDGKLYKVNPTEGATVGQGGAVEGVTTCTPKIQTKKAENPKGPKPVIISAECRCLEPPERPTKN